MVNNTLILQNGQLKLYHLDKIDNQIIIALHENSRTSLSEIGKRVGMSKDAVLYRINKLIKAKVIAKFFLDIDYEALGFNKYTLFIKLNKMSKKDIAFVPEVMNNISEIIFCASCVGHWDYWIEILSNSTKQFDKAVEKILNALGSNLQDYKFLIIFNEYKRYEPIIEEYFSSMAINSMANIKAKKKLVKPTFTHVAVLNTISNSGYPYEKLIKIDENDYKILKEIENNSRIPLVDVARNTKLSLDIVKYRLKKLQENKMIIKFDLVIDYNVLGYELNVVVFKLKKFTKEAKNKFKSYLMANKNVRSASLIIGQQEILIEVLSYGKEDYLNFLNRIRTLYSEVIQGYEEVRVVADVKDVTMPFIEF